MRETDKSIEEIVEEILSRDPRKIWSASCAICSLSQNHEKIMKLAPYKKQIVHSTYGIELGGGLAPNKRFLKYALKIIEWHERNEGCSCQLLGEQSNPDHLVEDGYFEMIEVVNCMNSTYVDYYRVRCKKCNTIYKVFERLSHMPWWEWK